MEKGLGEIFEDILDGIGESIIEVVKAFECETKIAQTITNPVRGLESLGAIKERHIINKGDHIYVHKLGYTHHGIYTGDDLVVHYLSSGVTYTPLDEFSNGVPVLVESTPSKYSADEVVRRAYSRLREKNYNLLLNNCEHFAIWCRNGD